MDCRTIQRFMSAYLDGEMDPARRDAFFDHLADCDACRERVGEATWLEATLAISMKRRMTAPASIRYNVLNAIHRESARRAPVRRGFAWRPAAAMAAVLALGSAGWRTLTTAFQPAPAVQAEARTAPNRVASLPRETARADAPKPAVAAPMAPAKRNAPAPRPAAAPHITRIPAPRVSAPAVVPANPSPAAILPAPAPPARTRVEPNRPAPPDGPVGTVTSISAPPDVVSARFLARREGKAAWEDATANLHARTRLHSGDETIVTMTLNDGTVLKSNQHTEFVVLRSPTRDDPSWGIRLIRGEVWVNAHSPVVVSAPSMRVEARDAEFSVRSMNGEDAAVMTVAGSVTARNDEGAVDVSAGKATSAPAGGAPEEAFPLANPRVQLDWVYGPPEEPAQPAPSGLLQ